MGMAELWGALPAPRRGQTAMLPPSLSLAMCPPVGNYFGLELVSCLCQVASWHHCMGNSS